MSYQSLYDNCEISGSAIPQIDHIIDKIVVNKPRYETVSNSFTSMPFWFVAVIHQMEGSMNFNTHLHNGDPLTARTVHVPAGRPRTGEPPFTWEHSAIDALLFEGYDKVFNYSIANVLSDLEHYNGMGYRHHNINSPYLWAQTNQYFKGKFTSDGHFDPNAVSQQIGAAAIIKRMEERKLL